MKYRAYNTYLCIVRDRVGLCRTPAFPLPGHLPLPANPPDCKAGANRPARRLNPPWRTLKSTSTKGLSSAKNGSSARFVDSPTVVIQSRLTPRAQLRAVAQTLRRMERPAAGFVFNRVLIRKARSWFRQAVPGVEQRLGHPPRSQPTGPSEPWLYETAQELSVVTKRELVKPADSALSSDASPQPAAPPQTATPFSDAASIGTAAPEVESTRSTRVARGRGEPQRPASSPRTSRSANPRPPAPVPPAGPAASSSRRAAPAVEPLASAPPAEPAPPVNSLVEHAAPLPPATLDEAMPDDLAAERADYPPSRLSGLRNLLVSLGRRSLSQADGLPDTSDPDIEPRFERATVRPAYQDSAGSADRAPENSAPARLTAQPEFLPPRPTAELEREREKEAVRPTSPRRESPDGEEIQTLPSWRGQYRKKRYPPI